MQISVQNVTQLLKNKIYTSPPKFCRNISENDKIMLFQPRQHPQPA